MSATHVRVYLTYLILTIVVDLCIVAYFLLETSCPAHEANVCGVNRILSELGLVVSIMGQSYVVFVIESYCNELANFSGVMPGSTPATHGAPHVHQEWFLMLLWSVIHTGGPRLQDLLVGRAVEKENRMNEICYATSHFYGEEGSMNSLLSAEYGSVVKGETCTGFTLSLSSADSSVDESLTQDFPHSLSIHSCEENQTHPTE